MASHRVPVVADDSSQEAIGSEPQTDTSPAEMQAFYEDMERRELLERKLSDRKSISGTSVWSHRTAKPTNSILQPAPMPDLARKSSANSAGQQINGQHDPSEDDNLNDSSNIPNPLHQLNPSRSIISDSRNINGSVESDPWDSVPLPTFKVYYPLHNPMGPRWYRNYHLIPPSQIKPSMRPPTFFSPSFPPMASSSPTEHVDSPGASSSHSPHATPSSSQTKVATRTRKTSQTAPDTVDLLDVTDPWGTNWHHQSPYDIGKLTTVAADPYEMPSRPRRASMSTAQGHRSVIPSPLSQSTSAVHLHQPLQSQIQIPRKLSKRRPSAGSIFRSSSDRKANSVPTTPVESASIIPGPPPSSIQLPKRMSVAPPVDLTAYKREKRGSILGRLVKKLSIMKKPSDHSDATQNAWQPPTNEGAYSTNGNMYGNDIVFRREQSPEKQESIRRVPPPTFDPPDEQKPSQPPPSNDNCDDRASISSLDTPFSRGRLTIANPDSADGDEGATPPSPNAPDSNHADHPIDAPTEPSESANPRASIRHSRYDKPLPPPHIGTLENPDHSHIALSDLGILQAIKTNPSTPETKLQELPIEQPSPPPPPPPPSEEKPRSPENESPVIADDTIVVDSPAPVEPSADTKDVAQEETKEEEQVEVKPEPTVSKPPTPSPSSLPPIQTTPTHRLSVDKRRTRSPPIQSRSPSIFETPRRPSDPTQDTPPGSRHGTPSRDVTPPKRSRRSQDRSGPASPRSQAAQPNPIAIRPFERPKSRKVNGVASPPPVSNVPFPAVHSAVPFLNSDSRLSMASYVESVSVVVNPPTPYTNRLSLAISEPPTLPPKSIYEDKEGHNQTPVSPTRQTEVFKLVRSPSGNAYMSTDTIQAAGEHWEVVGSVPNDSKAKPNKTKETEAKVRESVRSRAYDEEEEDYDYERKLKEHELEREKEWEREKERQREREKQALEREREKERERERERVRERERERERVREREKEKERLREYEREKERERERERERARQKDRERERTKERERLREKEKEREREKVREREREKEREREREREKEREREREKEREREREKEKEKEKEKEREREKEKLRERERDRERRHREREESFYTARDYERHSKTYDMIPKELPPNPRDAEHRPRILEPESRSLDRRSKNHHEYSSRDHTRRGTEDSRRSRDDERRANERETSARETENRDSVLRTKERESRTKEYSNSHHHNKEELKPVVVELSSNHRPEGRRLSKQAAPLPEATSKHRSSDKRTVRQSDEAVSYNDYRSSKRVEEANDRRAERKAAAEQHTSVTYHTLAPTTVYVQMPNAAPDHLRPGHQSVTIRPTSELPSPEEMNAVRAKESWEMERLWKARSMYGLEPNAPTTNFIPGPGSTSSFSDETPTPPAAVHGSSYTAYVVQPFQATPSHIYHSMPPAPPPVIYSSPASIPSIPDFLSSSDPAENYQQLSHPISSSVNYRPLVDPSRLSSYNPLPAPPRESKYEPAPLTTIKPTKKIAADYFRPITTTR
ncbi:hypothetical protein BJ165DRAFT_536503 [Panaeolus papilionaceus]|nr:hypothetical protein BJ165DRAFT_536503 [Panaeolus papilionaceus]